jgi:hypothetical protein
MQEQSHRGKSPVQWTVGVAYLTIFFGCIWHGFQGDIAIGGGADGEGARPLPCLHVGMNVCNPTLPVGNK